MSTDVKYRVEWQKISTGEVFMTGPLDNRTAEAVIASLKKDIDVYWDSVKKEEYDGKTADQS